MSRELDFTPTKGRFPSPLLNNATKSSKKYGLAYAQAIFALSVDGATSYYNTRNLQYEKNRKLSAGKQDFEPLLKIMDINGSSAYTQLSYHPRGIALKFKEVVLNKMMERNERVKVSSLSLGIKERKERKKSDALFRMKNKEWLAEVQQESGIQLEDEDAYVPDSEEELDIYSELNDQELEELLMQEMISFVFDNNKYNPDQKRQLLSDLWDCGLAVSKDYIDGYGRIRTRVIKPEQTVYAPTSTVNFDDSSYFGHIELIKVASLREMLSDKEIDGLEEKLYHLSFSNRDKFNNGGDLPASYSNEWNDAYDRPYDDYLVQVMFFEAKLPKEIIYTTGKNNYGRNIFDLKQQANPKLNPNKQTKITKRTTIYEGAWVIGSELMLRWGEANNILVDQSKENLEFSYSARFINNNDGKMLPRSMADLMRSPIENMDIAILKIQHLAKKIRPNGFNIDVDVVADMDLGEGIGSVSILQLREIADQTGDTYYSGKKIDGENANRKPIEQNIYQDSNNIQGLMEWYNFEQRNLQNLIGTNDYVEGSSVDPRLGNNVLQTQISQSNTATAGVYNTFVSIKNDTARHFGIRLWDTLKYSKNPNEGYLQILGKKNVDFIKFRKDITDSNYDLAIELDMSDAERVKLEARVEAALQSGMPLRDAEYVLNARDYKKGLKYLAVMEAKRKREEAEQARDNTKYQVEAQKESAMVASQAKQQEIATESQAKVQEITVKGQLELSAKELDIVKSAMDKLLENPDLKLPVLTQMLVDRYIKMEQQRQQQEEQERQMAEEQAMMEQEQMAMQEQEY